MKIINSTIHEPICLCLGFFDSVHLGHRAIIERAKQFAASGGAKSCILTFTNNPSMALGANSALIYTYSERLSIFERFSIDYVLPFEFNKAFCDISPQEFLEMLVKTYNIKAFVCGHDYTFGAGGKGNAQLLTEFSQKNDIKSYVMPPFIVDNERVSSSQIKRLLASGDVEKANVLLGEPYFIVDKVVRGRGRGHLFDFPTANISLNDSKLTLKHGVYATKTVIDGKEYASVTNIGARPTFSDSQSAVETLIDDFSADIYDKTIEIKFFSYLRDTRKFESPQKLLEQIKLDMAQSDKIVKKLGNGERRQ